MRLAIRWIPAVLIALGIPLCPAQDTGASNTLTPQEKAAGWQLLFDGKTMAGWEDPAKQTPPGDAWTIEDGCLKAVRRARIREDLVTKATFRDFELLFDWRIGPRGNSGVKYRIQKRVFLESGKARPGVKSFEETVGYELVRGTDRNKTAPGSRGEDYVISFEYQVIDDNGHPDAMRGPRYAAGSLYSLVGPSRAAARPIGEFNHSRLVVRGNRVEHWLNGVKVVDTTLDSLEVLEGLEKRWGAVKPVYDLLAKPPRQDCPIALQNHGDEAWFRNIKIRPLK